MTTPNRLIAACVVLGALSWMLPTACSRPASDAHSPVVAVASGATSLPDAATAVQAPDVASKVDP